MPSKTTKTLHLRIKDKHAQVLSSLAREVNMVWNYINELSFTHTQRTGKFFSSYDLQNYTKGATKEGLKLNSASVQMIGAEYVTRRKQFKKVKLNWRVSNPKSPKRSLGWIPFRHDCIGYEGGQIRYAGLKLGLWDSYGLSNYELGSGSISEDARGCWYLNVTVTSPGWPKSVDLNQVRTEAIGIDLGLKDLIAVSDGTTVKAQQFYRDLEPKLAVAQRAGQKARVRSIHAKISNRRKDHLHKLTTALVGKHQAIFVGDVSASKLVKTSMAKSVLDAGVWFSEINESYSTQECGSCGARTGPKGRAGLNERTWTCSVCLTHHDRDLNSANVIRARGLVWLEKEFPSTGEARAGEAVVNKNPTRVRGRTGPLAVGIPVLSHASEQPQG